MSATITLPDELAPALRQRVLDLVSQVHPLELAPHYPIRMVRRPDRHRCAFCHRGGKLGGHHQIDGAVTWTHKSCHRHHHRSETRRAAALRPLRAA